MWGDDQIGCIAQGRRAEVERFTLEHVNGRRFHLARLGDTIYIEVDIN